MEQIIQLSNQYWFTFFLIYIVSAIVTIGLTILSAFLLDKCKTAVPAFCMMFICGIGSIISTISCYLSIGMVVMVLLGWIIF